MLTVYLFAADGSSWTETYIKLLLLVLVLRFIIYRKTLKFTVLLKGDF